MLPSSGAFYDEVSSCAFQESKTENCITCMQAYTHAYTYTCIKHTPPPPLPCPHTHTHTHTTTTTTTTTTCDTTRHKKTLLQADSNCEVDTPNRHSASCCIQFALTAARKPASTRLERKTDELLQPRCDVLRGEVRPPGNTRSRCVPSVTCGVQVYRLDT